MKWNEMNVFSSLEQHKYLQVKIKPTKSKYIAYKKIYIYRWSWIWSGLFTNDDRLFLSVPMRTVWRKNLAWINNRVKFSILLKTEKEKEK